MMSDFRRDLANASPYARARFAQEAEEYDVERRRALEQHMMEEVYKAQEEYMRRSLLPVPSGVDAAKGAFVPLAPPQPKSPTINPDKLKSLREAEPYKVNQRMPDLMEVITAWRAWGITDKKGELRLKALGQNHVWKPREMMQATCINHKHSAPQMKCQCGVWAFKELDGLVSAVNAYRDVRVIGQVSLWGKVVETQKGYRAERAYPRELWLMSSDLEELGMIYDVPVRCVD